MAEAMRRALFNSPYRKKKVGQLLLAIRGHHLGGRLQSPLVHTHVERTLEPERKSPLRVVEMVKRDTQIGQNPVDLLHAIVAHEVFQIPEIAVDKREPLIVETVAPGILVLVEREESSPFAQT